MSSVGLSLLCAVIVTCVYGSPTPGIYDTIVVGMGASGTAAATTLAAAGKKVLGLEAQDRIGGRVFTMPFGDGIIEGGAEWIHGTVNSVTYELAEKNNITILEQATDTKVFRSDGSSDKEDLVNELNNVAIPAYQDLPSEAMSLGQYMTKTVRDHLQKTHPEVLNDTDFLNNYFDYLEILLGTNDAYYSWNDITIKSTSEELAGSYSMSWHKYGYKTLFEILLNKYKNGPGYPTLDIKLNTEVVLIEYPQDPEGNVVVTVADGTKYTAKNIIITPSIAVLKEKYDKLFSPPLPKEKVDTIKAISMGESAKITLLFDEIWWQNEFGAWVWRDADKSNVSKEDSWLLKVNTPGPSMANDNVLTLWATGDAARTVETLPNEVVKEKVMGLLRRFMGAGRTIPEPVGIYKSAWYSNPYVRGVYSYDDINTPNHPTVRADLSQPLVDSSGAPRVLFAGEATNSKYYGTVHGAVETGYREAQRLLSSGSY